MNSDKLIWLLAAVVVIVVFMYMILPRLKLNIAAGKVLRAILFFGMMLWLGIDFYQKGKYWYILILGMGSIGFSWMLFTSRNNRS